MVHGARTSLGDDDRFARATPPIGPKRRDPRVLGLTSGAETR